MATWDRPIAPSLRPDNQVLYLDPPAWIGDAFGGRSWFAEMRIHSIHRIGLLSGLGWMLHSDHHTDRVNGVRIVCIDRQNKVFNLTFGRYECGPEVCDTPKMVIRSAFREKVKHTLLKAVYAEVLGEQCV